MRNTPDYKVIRSKRQTLSITVDREGNVIVRAPLSLPDDRIEKFVSEKSDWIEKYSRTARARVGERSARLSKPPMELPLFGGMCPVDNVQPYGYTGGKFHLPEGVALEELLPYLRRLYSTIAKGTLIARTRLTADRMGIEIADVKVNSAKTRWGSCSAQKVINLSWKLVAADISLIDYVIVHELCHTRQMNHSEAVWENVRMVIPDYKERREALKDVQKVLSEFGLD